MNIRLTLSVLLFGYISGSQNLNWKYHVSTDFQTWFQALINCKSAGMELVSITSEEEQNRLDQFLSEDGFNQGYWTSGTNLGNGTYFWASTGKAIAYFNWLPGQPENAKLQENKYRGENCIQLGYYNNTDQPAGWNDLYCHIKLLYICQESDECDNKI